MALVDLIISLGKIFLIISVLLSLLDTSVYMDSVVSCHFVLTAFYFFLILIVIGRESYVVQNFAHWALNKCLVNE